MDHERRDLLSTAVPRWLGLLCVTVLVAAGVAFALVVKGASGATAPRATRSVVAVTIPPNGIPGVTPQTTPDYTALVLSGSALQNLDLPDTQPWSSVGDVAEGQVATIGDIVLCSSGTPGSVRIVSVAALRASNPLHVVGFSTRPVESQTLGFDIYPLDQSGFPAHGAEVAPCHGSYQQALVGVHHTATTELGVEFEMTSDYQEADHGLVLTYQGPDGVLRTLNVPIDILFCAKSWQCTQQNV